MEKPNCKEPEKGTGLMTNGPIANPHFTDIQNILDAIAAADTSNPLPTSPHNTDSGAPFWRETGNLDTDYITFTTGTVPNFGSQIMDQNDPLNSLFLTMLLGTGPAVQMPLGGPFITDDDYQVSVNGSMMSGSDIRTTLESWLQSGFPK